MCRKTKIRAHPMIPIDVYPTCETPYSRECAGAVPSSLWPCSSLDPFTASTRGTDNARVFIHATGHQDTVLHDLGESHQAVTPKCHLPRCEPSKFEHVGEDVGSIGQST